MENGGEKACAEPTGHIRASSKSLGGPGLSREGFLHKAAKCCLGEAREGLERPSQSQATHRTDSPCQPESTWG